MDGTGNIIGGTSPGDGNVISGNQFGGVDVGGVTDTLIEEQPHRNQRCRHCRDSQQARRRLNRAQATGTIVGGTTPSARNVISGSEGAGVSLAETTGCVVEGNYIGTDVTGTQPIGNYDGVLIGEDNLAASNNTIGGTEPGAGNVILGNAVQVVVQGGSIGNEILSNAIFSNQVGGEAILFQAASDPSETDPNDLQNFPVIATVSSAGGTTHIVRIAQQHTQFNPFWIRFFLCQCLGRPQQLRTRAVPHRVAYPYH